MAKKLWGRCPKVTPTGILLRRRCTHSKGTVKLQMCHYESGKGALISACCTHSKGTVKLQMCHYESEKGALISA